MNRWAVVGCLGAASLGLSEAARAEPSLSLEQPVLAPSATVPADDGVLREGSFSTQVNEGFSRRYWVIGVGAEYFTSAARSVGDGGEELLGLTAMWRLGAFGPHALLMVKPSVERIQDSRGLAGLGLRGFYDIQGFTEISYGVGGHLEARLADHFWLGYLTPLELGAVVWSEGSWNIQAFFGVRRAVAGELINYFLLDPNGFDNADAQDELDSALHGTPWRAFVRLVFGRRVD